MWILYLIVSLIFFLVALVLFAVLPGRRRDRSPFDATLYAHRGLHSGDAKYPENSLIAFRLAKEAGYGVELDVQFTADRQVVVFHDDTLLRMCGVDKRVDQLTYAEIRELHLLDSNHYIPLLTEVLDVLDDATILCEFKTRPDFFDTSLCEAAYPILEKYKGNYCVESFNPVMMRWFKKNAPQVIRGILSKRFEEEDHVDPQIAPLLTALGGNFLCRPDFIAYRHTDADHPFFCLNQWFGPATIAWTIQSQAEQNTAETVFDTVIFEGYLPKKKEK